MFIYYFKTRRYSCIQIPNCNNIYNNYETSRYIDRYLLKVTELKLQKHSELNLYSIVYDCLINPTLSSKEDSTTS